MSVKNLIIGINVLFENFFTYFMQSFPCLFTDSRCVIGKSIDKDKFSSLAMRPNSIN